MLAPGLSGVCKSRTPGKSMIACTGAGSEVPPSEAPLQGGLKGLGARGGGTRSKGASPSEGFKGASRGLQGGLKGA